MHVTQFTGKSGLMCLDNPSSHHSKKKRQPEFPVTHSCFALWHLSETTAGKQGYRELYITHTCCQTYCRAITF